jgi:predicted dehydrogenase
MSERKIAIIGAGYWGVNYVRMFSDLLQPENVLVCDSQPDRLAEISGRFPGVQTTTALEDFLNRDDIDSAVICTPATTHHEVSRRALLAGKHLLVEKPLTRVAEDAEELISIARERDLTLMVGHTFIHNPAVRKVKSFVERGDAGKLYYLYSQRTNMGPIRKDVNAIWDLAPHDVSIFNYLVGSRPDWVSAVGARVLGNGREDVGFITLGYPGGVIGNIHVSWADPNKVRQVVVVGSDKRIVFDDLNMMERVRIFEKGVRAEPPESASYGEHMIQMRDGDIISPRIEVSEPLKNQALHFLECVEKGTEPITDGQSGMDVVRVMEAIDRSVELNGAPVRIPAGKGTPELLGLDERPAEVPADLTSARRTKHAADGNGREAA